MGKKTGFTLAEVLVTLLVIGAIAALTVPALLQRTQEAELKSAWKKSYSDLRQVASRIIADKGGSLKGFNFETNTLRNAFTSYMTYTEICDAGQTSNNCWLDQGMISPSGGVVWNEGTVSTKLSSTVLNNGSVVFFLHHDDNCNNNLWSGQIKICSEIAVDVNGLRGPNQIGKDLFSMWLTENNLVPRGSQGDVAVCYSGNWAGCSARYLYQ